MAAMRSMFRPHERVYADVGNDGMTKQEFLEETDINVLMKRFEKAGQWPPAPQREPQYFDVTEMPTDFQSAMNFMIDAEDAFMSIPAEARFALGNDPAKFVEFAANPENLDQMRTWGLAPPLPPRAAPQEVRIVADDTPPAPPPKAAS